MLRKFDVLLFWSLDQLSREGVLETLQHLNRLTSHGVNYRSFTEQYFDSCGIFKDARPESTKNQRGKYRWSTKPNVPLRRTREFEKWSQEDSWTRTLKPRCHSHVENILAGIPVADLRSGDLDVLRDLSGGKNRLPKSMVDALSLPPRSTYADAVHSGIFAVQQLEMLNSWRWVLGWSNTFG